MELEATESAGVDAETVAALVIGHHGDPFAVLGLHEARDANTVPVIRAFLPRWRAGRLWVIDADDGCVVCELPRLHEQGFFAGPIRDRRQGFRYRLRASVGKEVHEFEDPYRFPPLLREADLHLFEEGNHFWIHEMLGAHPQIVEGVAGVVFAVWAPNASRVSVVGGFNEWDGRCHPMRLRRECGVWEIFLPEISAGELYKYEIKSKSAELLPLKSDPCGFCAERPPATASIVCRSDDFEWRDESWRAGRKEKNARGAPISIYEVHLGSCKRDPDGRYLTYRALADQLVPYASALGFTHIEVLPVAEHTLDGSWGYQPTGLFAPTSRFGTPDEFRYFVQCCHDAGIGVLLDWVPGHFPRDAHSLGFFDGTCLYEDVDPRQGQQADWRTLIYNFGRPEVAAFLISNALYWIREFHVDGLRIDAVASMLYLDYSRKSEEWIANECGGRENLEAIAFLQHLNEAISTEGYGAVTVAEDSTAWPMISRPTYIGGLGFGYRWNLGWMHNTLRYIAKDPIYRRYHHGDITFGLPHAFAENFISALSHDEVVHGKGSLFQRMPGDAWGKFANLRLYLAFLYTQPGKKLLFMGAEFAQLDEWSHERGLDWDLLSAPRHRGVQSLVSDLNGLYRRIAALHELDCEAAGFEWIDCKDLEHSVVSFLRFSRRREAYVTVVCNFTPVVRRNYRIGVPTGGRHREILNTDALEYSGSGVGNAGYVEAELIPCHDRPHSLVLTLPPLSVLVLQPEDPSLP